MNKNSKIPDKIYLYDYNGFVRAGEINKASSLSKAAMNGAAQDVGEFPNRFKLKIEDIDDSGLIFSLPDVQNLKYLHGPDAGVLQEGKIENGILEGEFKFVITNGCNPYLVKYDKEEWNAILNPAEVKYEVGDEVCLEGQPESAQYIYMGEYRLHKYLQWRDTLQDVKNHYNILNKKNYHPVRKIFYPLVSDYKHILTDKNETVTSVVSNRFKNSQESIDFVVKKCKQAKFNYYHNHFLFSLCRTKDWQTIPEFASIYA